VKITKPLIAFLLALVLAWGLPALFKLGFEESNRVPFCYYSTPYNKFFYMDVSGKDLVYKDQDEKIYTEEEFDQALPMFFYRQLVSDGRMPDSIKGVPIEPKQIGIHQFYFRYKPKEKNRPAIPLYSLLESMSGRVNLSMPDDIFTFRNGITFMDVQQNAIKVNKTAQFQEALKAEGFQGKPLIVAGNPTTQKPYDEGYFLVSEDHQLFHLKMVNGRPFVRNCHIPENIKPQYIQVTEYPARAFYGFMIDKQEQLYLIGPEYKLQKVPSGSFNPETDNLLIMGSMFYWNMRIYGADHTEYIALNADDLQVVDTLEFRSEISGFATYDQWIFPIQLKLTSYYDEYVKPRFQSASYKAFLLNMLLVLIALFMGKRRKKNMSILLPWTGAIIIGGIFLFIPYLILER